MSTGLHHLLATALVMIFIVLAGSRWRWHPFLVLLAAALLLCAFCGFPAADWVGLLNDGFAGMVKKVGLIIVLGSLTGTVLEKSSALQTIANAILQAFGPRHSHAALTVVGAVVGIPIFCDSGFIILHGLVGPLAAGAGLSRLSLSTGLAGGLYVTHCLLPPHPGATAGAATLGLKENLGLVMMLGFALALPLTLVAHWGSRRLKDATGLHREETSFQPIATTQKLPSLWLSILPILAPLFLLGLGAATPLSASPPWMQLLGSPVMALGTGFLLSLACLHGRAGKMEISQWFNQSVLHAGGIVVIVGAGGMLGEAIKHTSISQLLGQWLQQGQFSALAFLCIAWLVAVVLKTAQGSTTSAIIVVTAMLAPLLGPAGMAAPLPAALVLLSVCTGTMMVSHANDAYFWVITEFAQLPMKQGFRGFTRLSVLLGLSGLAIVLLLGAVLL